MSPSRSSVLKGRRIKRRPIELLFLCRHFAAVGLSDHRKQGEGMSFPKRGKMFPGEQKHERKWNPFQDLRYEDCICPERGARKDKCACEDRSGLDWGQ